MIVETIDRDTLRDVARRAIDEATEYMSPPEGAVEAVMEAVASVDVIAGDITWWSEENQCGCLTGSVHRGRWHDFTKRDRWWAVLGSAYLDALREVVGIATAPVLRVTGPPQLRYAREVDGIPIPEGLAVRFAYLRKGERGGYAPPHHFKHDRRANPRGLPAPTPEAISPRGGETLAFLHDAATGERLATGLARCSDGDNFNKATGRKIALGRALSLYHRNRRARS